MMRQYELVERVRAYDPDADEAKLNRAYVYAMMKHGSQKRASGDPYFSHPLEVAGILTRLRLDVDSIVTALLHDTIEDTDATLEEIEKLFGKSVARLVNGVTKLSQIELKSSESKQAENFRKLVLAMSEDIRVLLVKLADRLHNMQTLHYIPKIEKRQRIAQETLDIYAPLAERIGMHDVKDELEDLAFAQLYPDVRDSILTRLAFLRDNGGTLKEEIIAKLKADLQAAHIEATVYGREKKPFSIWRKMRSKNITLEQLSDIMAFRVTVESTAQCYAALGTIHSTYQIVPGRFKDYISLPKPNGYQSLHTTIIGPKNHRIEVQIRTQEMHEVAELGVAAHWVYKQQNDKEANETKQYKWLRDLLEILEQASDPEEFLEHTKLAMFDDQVFCFSPKGDLIALPRGSTPVDFAYAVHSAVGDACTGARVNGRIVPLKTELQNGDQVEVITQKGHQPSPSWEKFVVSARAKAHIRRFVRTQQREQYIELGKGLIDKAFKDVEKEYTETQLDSVLSKFNVKQRDDLYVAIGEGHFSGREVAVSIYPDIIKQEREQREENALDALLQKKPVAPKTSAYQLPITGLIPGMAVHYAKCCHPIRGDKIVGLIVMGKGVTVHTEDCHNLNAFKDKPERFIDVAWEGATAHEAATIARLKISLENATGALGTMCALVGQARANIHNMKIAHRTTDHFDILLDVEVDNTEHLTSVMAILRAHRSVHAIERIKN